MHLTTEAVTLDHCRHHESRPSSGEGVESHCTAITVGKNITNELLNSLFSLLFVTTRPKPILKYYWLTLTASARHPSIPVWIWTHVIPSSARCRRSVCRLFSVSKWYSSVYTYQDDVSQIFVSRVCSEELAESRPRVMFSSVLRNLSQTIRWLTCSSSEQIWAPVNMSIENEK